MHTIQTGNFEEELQQLYYRQYYGWTGIFSLEPNIVILTKAKVFIRIDQFLTFETEIEYDTQVTRIWNHNCQVFARYVWWKT